MLELNQSHIFRINLPKDPRQTGSQGLNQVLGQGLQLALKRMLFKRFGLSVEIAAV